MKTTLIGVALPVLAAICAAATQTSHPDSGQKTALQKGEAMPWKTPQSLQAEHKDLHEQLLRATQAGGETAAAARAVAKVLHPHFEKEDKYALPPLGLLPALAEGKVTAEMEVVLELTDKLQTELPQMLKEHQEIVAALKNLANAAKEEGKPEHVHFAEKLIVHAQTEEEVLYPTAVLIGKYIKLQRNK